ncbi:MAG: hypothetical protein LBD57_04255 [Endomicrobium sp.]|jgi:hypothetical protein|uniref:hypothetical protein n=1 Tax=Candidatus Endomicrobiellum cubanum TaxID=3242325 RepID=UPI00281B8470|nr:hypothetical protein [Endomicrobium sp.]
MLKKTIKYVDYDGNEREEDFYFNLSKAELIEIEMNVPGGLEKKLKKIIAAQDGKEIMAIFKEIVTKAYGEKSPDGRRFIKSKALSDEFLQTEAYSELFMEITTDADKGALFVNSLLPAGLMDEVNKRETANFITNKTS